MAAGSFCTPAARGISVADTGLDLVQHFAGMFENDFSMATTYDVNTDGLGYAAGYTISGSPSFTPHKRAPLDVNEAMRITPFSSPTQSEDVMIDLIERANDTLYIEQMYIYETLDDILLAIIAAKGAGVDVRVIQDDGSDDHNNISATILEGHGIPVKRMVENAAIGAPFNTMHNKGVIVDGEIVLVCSVNWSPTSLRDNRETGVIIESETVAGYYQDLFLYDWSVAADFTPTRTYPDPNPDSSHYFAPTTFSGKFDITCLAAPDNCFDVVCSLLAGANESIWISTYTLSSPFILDALHERLAAGVSIKLLLAENPVSDSEKNYNKWTMANLTSIGAEQSGGNMAYASGKWASTTFQFQHCKYAIIDSKTLIISSGNYAQTSCPKPKTNGDVDGNRDWWIVVRGSKAGTTPGAEPVLIIIACSGVAAVLVARSRRRIAV
jgi:phosphatidylserine/phosphatidylglycerophosphate/cardiolipin synthase-like enzyme